ncbi:Diguanylate cyclase DosC [Bhargavaea cecembensis DSE10]|uniref:Diguanylate cyclase DosC n=2 Tax=Bhargavaea cecembensis TaxID=394098 RepID=M7NIP6_9BACL|nr:Diguanylate cyclase DosC [Bhargavaea cecembensis DSE10]
MAYQALQGPCGQKLIMLEKELQRLRELVYMDALTGLLNYRAFKEEMQKRLDTGKAFGLLYLDLDRFKQVNDQFGHLAGDRLLREVASVLEIAAGLDAQVYRLGGDEFALIADTGQDIETVHERILLGFEQEDKLKIGDLRIGVSIGSAKFPEDGRTYEELLGLADCCMYADKHRRKADHFV